jgi:hypothetical protein
VYGQSFQDVPGSVTRCGEGSAQLPIWLPECYRSCRCGGCGSRPRWPVLDSAMSRPVSTTSLMLACGRSSASPSSGASLRRHRRLSSQHAGESRVCWLKRRNPLDSLASARQFRRTSGPSMSSQIPSRADGCFATGSAPAAVAGPVAGARRERPIFEHFGDG